MKTRCGLVVLAALFAWLHLARAGDSDVNITCEKKKMELPGASGGAHSDYTKKSEQWGYTVSVENQGFTDLGALQVKYIIYYKHEELGVKGPAQKKTKTGTYSIDKIASLGKTSFDTDSVTLSKSALVGPMGGYSYFGNGAKSSVADTLAGLWVRIYKDGNLFAEYSYPAGLTSSETWQE
jgi:hypothetical protein